LIFSYGVCVWSTGIEPKSIAADIAAQIPQQNHSKALRVDKYLKVIGSDNIYAAGDCSVVESPKLKARMNELFLQFDKDKDGALSYEEMEIMISSMRETFPQLEVYQNKVKKLFEEFDTDKDNRTF
jgi:Ca2+-binding EF-hand superfamily protein